jgi:hypothetical protein
MHGFHNITYSVRVDGIVNEFAIPFGFNDTRPSQNGQVLGGY